MGAGGSSLIQDAPSSHGSSLAAVLNWATGLTESTASSTLPPQGGAVPEAGGRDVGKPQPRTLRHSSEGDGFSSWKTADGGMQGSQDLQGLDSGLSSLASCSQAPAAVVVHAAPHQQRHSMASARQPDEARPGVARRASAAAAVGSPAQPAHSRTLSGAAATQRVLSLQEEQLRGFLTSSKEDIAKQQKPADG